MENRYQTYRSGIRFFPHIFPIAFPLIFPLGLGVALFLFRLLFPLLIVLFVAALIFFVVRTIQLGSMDAAWSSMLGTGRQWQQRFTTQSQPRQPYYQPSQPSQPQQPYYQPSQPYYQPSQPQQPYYQPFSQTEQPQQSYGQGYVSGRPSTTQVPEVEQPGAHYREQMPPMQQ